MLSVGLMMGIAGTVAMDLWAWLLSRVAGIAMPNWGMVGRWVGHLPRGRVFHEDIAAAGPVPAESALGWAFHYAVGAAYGVAFAWIAGPGWLAEPGFLPVWAFAIATIGFGWFLLQPGLGLGWAASATPSPWKVRGLGLLAHTVFALGMWAAALAA